MWNIISPLTLTKVDGSGDCSDDLLQLHYPDEDIPQELIGFLDDKVPPQQ